MPTEDAIQRMRFKLDRFDHESLDNMKSILLEVVQIVDEKRHEKMMAYWEEQERLRDELARRRGEVQARLREVCG